MALFPVLDSDEYENREEWNFLAITVFDHWLSQDEAIRYFDHRTDNEQASFDTTWSNFYQLLASELDPYLVKYRSPSRVVFKEPKSVELLASRLSIAKDGSFITLVFPEQRAIYEQYYDDTHLLYFECTEKVKPLLDLVKSSGLYSLSRI
ncbi:hypothetical protein [Photobacterium alginatilyticum]|uniref:Uncharacterized protein n=1 Tax=Photobacterium alginatilyticum TaxID=1775171 RepID=A0ABW9YSA7_9GAMM|nr:hypothetical protein [Photobacterium alginatilyticum]NBI56321.1 hypothetical protein [Photobacterium alginatilyticum]